MGIQDPADGSAHEQADHELVGHLVEQVQFLRTSAVRFDEGDDAEAKRLALVVRTLCHETSSSHSLLGQLNLLDTLEFVDTATPAPPDLEPESGVDDSVETFTVTMFASPLAPMGGGPRGYTPLLDTFSARRGRPFSEWWGAVVLEDPGHRMTRRDVVLALANQDGGAHIDPVLGDTAYAAMSRDASLGTIGYRTVDGREHAIDVNPVLMVMRQIALEINETLASIVGTAQ
jgi:hypothetical protein